MLSVDKGGTLHTDTPIVDLLALFEGVDVPAGLLRETSSLFETTALSLVDLFGPENASDLGESLRSLALARAQAMRAAMQAQRERDTAVLAALAPDPVEEAKPDLSTLEATKHSQWRHT